MKVPALPAKGSRKASSEAGLKEYEVEPRTDKPFDL